MKKLPTLSVVIPNYNHSEPLPTCLRAFLNQSVQADEIVVVDDGSTDNSVEVIEEFARKHPSIKLYRNDVNRGVNYSCNRGLDLVTGDFVLVAAADDEVLPGLIEKSLQLLAEYPHAGLCCNITEMSDMATGATWYLGSQMSDRPRYFSPQEMTELARKDKLHIFTSGMIVHRRSFLQAGKYLADLRWHSDWFALFIVGFRKGVCFVPEPLSQFRIYSASFSNKGRKQTAQQLAVVRAILKRLNEPQYQDVAPYIRKAGVLAPLGKEMLWAIISERRHWKYLTARYLWNTSWWIARVEARKILPRRAAEFCLKVAGFKRLPKTARTAPVKTH